MWDPGKLISIIEQQASSANDLLRVTSEVRHRMLKGRQSLHFKSLNATGPQQIVLREAAEQIVGALHTALQRLHQFGGIQATSDGKLGRSMAIVGLTTQSTDDPLLKVALQMQQEVS